VGVLLISCCVAAVNVFVGPGAPLLQFFLYGLIWSVQLILMALYLPYDSLKRNVHNVLVGFATLAHSAIFLGVQRGGANSGFMVGILVIFALLLGFVLFREKLAIQLPWLHIVRRADMQREEAEILHAAEEMDRQLDDMFLFSSVPPPPRRPAAEPRSIQRPPPVDEERQIELTDQGRQWQQDLDKAAAATVASPSEPVRPSPATLVLDAGWKRELAAEAKRSKVNSATAGPFPISSAQAQRKRLPPLAAP